MTAAHLVGAVYALDTNVLSELISDEVDRTVLLWLDKVGTQRIAIPAPVVTEVLYGVEILPAGRKRDGLSARFEEMMGLLFLPRIIDFGRREAEECARIMAKKRALGESLEDHLADAMIAACALTSGLAVATRNESEFRNTGVKVVNPWRAKR